MKPRSSRAKSHSRFTSIPGWMKKSRRRVIAAAIITVCVVALSFALSQKRSYSLNTSVTHSVYTIPKNVEWYAEVLEPEQLYSIFEGSAFGKSIIESKAWEKLAGTPEFHAITSLLYFIELKAGITISYREIPSFLGGSAGMAKMGDGSLLIVAKTNIKSRFTLALISAFKGKPVTLPEAASKAKKKLEGVTADSYTELFNEEQIAFANLNVTKINTRKGELFLVMLDDYLFVSDSADTLKESLYLATQNDPSSVRKIEGMKEAVTAFENGGQILFYSNGSTSSAAPLLTSFVKGGEGAAVVLYPDKVKGLTGDIYALGEFEPKPAQAGPGFSKIIPLEQTVSLYSETTDIRDLLKGFDSLGDRWSALKEGSSGFFRSADIDSDEYFGGEKGMGLVFHTFEVFDKKPYPEFSLLYRAARRDTALAKALFKSGEPREIQFQGSSYTSLAAENKKYRPAFHAGKTMVISSDKADCEKIISASQGNRPVLVDDPSYAALGEYAAAPYHLVVSIPRAIEAVRGFFNYGAKRNGGYSSVTVERDIMPLTEPLARYETLHFASGLGKRKTGRIVLTEKKR